MPDGRTPVRDAVLAVAKRDPVASAAALADVMPGPVPVCAAHAAAAFETLSATRGEGMSGPLRLTLHDVNAYATAMHMPLSGREARWVLEQDAAFVAEVSNG